MVFRYFFFDYLGEGIKDGSNITYRPVDCENLNIGKGVHFSLKVDHGVFRLDEEPRKIIFDPRPQN